MDTSDGILTGNSSLPGNACPSSGCLRLKEETELAKEGAEEFTVGSMVPLDALYFGRCDGDQIGWAPRESDDMGKSV